MQKSISQLKRPSIQKLFAGYYHDETIAQAQKKEVPSSSFFQQQQPTSTKKSEVQDLADSNLTPSNSNYESSKVSTFKLTY